VTKVVKCLHGKHKALSANTVKPKLKQNTSIQYNVENFNFGHACVITNENKDEIWGPGCVA
jgi:hypothetical protein